MRSPSAGAADSLAVAEQLVFSGDQRVFPDLGRLLAHVERTRPRVVLAVVDRGAVDAIGAAPGLDPSSRGWEQVIFEDFSPNPRAEDALAAARLASDANVDAVIAVGGGSCLDVAKIAALAGPDPDAAAALVTGQRRAEAEPLPLYAMPTTSGTGSEATHFAAIYVEGRKVSVAHPRLRPAAVALDVAANVAMPAELAAVTGLDALGQALESLWANGSNATSRYYALIAARLATRFLHESVSASTERAREAMMWSAHLAGRAINISKTTAAHALSYELTRRYGIPHGLAVALTLGHVGAANALVVESTCVDPRGVAHVREVVQQAAAVLGTTPAALPTVLGDLLRRLNLPATLRDAGVPPAAVGDLAQGVDPVRLGNNPVRLTSDDVTRLLEDARQPACV